MKSPASSHSPAKSPSKAASKSPSQAQKRSTEPVEGGDGLQGEGNYAAARRHRESVEDFVESGKVDDAAREAAPHDAQEADEMQEAERIGQSHAKGEDPALERGRDRRR